MKRNVDIDQISDGNLYTKDSLVKISCNDCKGCDKCCHNMGTSIILDPYDIYQMTRATGKSFEELLNREIAMAVENGIILPHINMVGDGDLACSFLKEGRCSIHGNRPGICRLFPLGRIYNEDGSFNYFNQIHECNYPNKSKVKVKQWIAINELGKYEHYIRNWHDILSDLEEKLFDTNQEELKKLNMLILQMLFVTPYVGEDFYQEFDVRLAIVKEQI